MYGKEKIKILNQSNILLHLSLNEEFPLVQIECLGLGLPFISYSSVGGMNKILDSKIKNRFFFKEKEVNDANFEKIVTDIMYDKRIISDMKKNFQRYFSKEKMLNEFRKIGL